MGQPRVDFLARRGIVRLTQHAAPEKPSHLRNEVEEPRGRVSAFDTREMLASAKGVDHRQERGMILR